MHLLAQVEHLVLQRALAQGALHDQAQVVGVDRLGEEIVGAEAHCLDGLVDAAVAGHHDHGHRQGLLADFADQFHAVEARHLEVGQEQAVIVMLPAGKGLERFLAVAGVVHDDPALDFEERPQLVTNVLVVLSDQDAARLLSHLSRLRRARAVAGGRCSRHQELRSRGETIRAQ